jgi:hypothetical protein
LAHRDAFCATQFLEKCDALRRACETYDMINKQVPKNAKAERGIYEMHSSDFQATKQSMRGNIFPLLL